MAFEGRPQVGGMNDPPTGMTFRRSGHTRFPVPANLSLSWESELGGRLTPPVVAVGKAFVAKVDEHTVYALDARTGRVLWHFTAGRGWIRRPR